MARRVAAGLGFEPREPVKAQRFSRPLKKGDLQGQPISFASPFASPFSSTTRIDAQASTAATTEAGSHMGLTGRGAWQYFERAMPDQASRPPPVDLQRRAAVLQATSRALRERSVEIRQRIEEIRRQVPPRDNARVADAPTFQAGSQRKERITCLTSTWMP